MSNLSIGTVEEFLQDSSIDKFPELNPSDNMSTLMGKIRKTMINAKKDLSTDKNEWGALK